MTDWEEDCMEYRGEILTGRYSHWCMEWDDLPIDETCFEWPCGCGIQEAVDAEIAASPDSGHREEWE